VRIRPETAQLWRGGVIHAREGEGGSWMSGDGARGDPSFRMDHRLDTIESVERGVLALAGDRKGPG
jgi:hypothetical protein